MQTDFYHTATSKPFSLFPKISSVPTFAEKIIRWQKRDGRHDLPWQNTRDPYRIWVSEIMLQQTQVSAVIEYYARFMTRFPDIATLAATPIDDVMPYWAGLGYYGACAQSAQGRAARG